MLRLDRPRARPVEEAVEIVCDPRSVHRRGAKPYKPRAFLSAGAKAQAAVDWLMKKADSLSNTVGVTSTSGGNTAVA